MFDAEKSRSNGADDDEDVAKLVQYPENLSYKDLLYFLCAPTLCYELNFPRTSRVRKHFLLKRLLELVIGLNVVMALFQQWIIPSVRNSLIPFSNMDIGLATERMLKLAVSIDNFQKSFVFNTNLFEFDCLASQSFSLALLLLFVVPFIFKCSGRDSQLCGS